MLSRWLLRLIGQGPFDLPREAPHGVVSRWLDDDDNHRGPSKPYAISAPRVWGNVLLLEVRLLDDQLPRRLAATAVTGLSVHLGGHDLILAAPPECAESQPWPGHTEGSEERAWDVEFCMPTTFRRGDRSSPWPAPESVAVGLAARWRALEPKSAPELPPDRLRSVWVSDLTGQSQVFTLRGQVVSGYLGRVRYVSDGPDAAAAFARLLRFAAFAGIGSHTTFGLGEVRVRPSWQPGPSRR